LDGVSFAPRITSIRDHLHDRLASIHRTACAAALGAQVRAHAGAAHPNARLEAFCDGVFAIGLTLLIIDIKIPGSEGIRTNILITWVNHHSARRSSSTTR
jgi:Endosomal/lysosomal potassium channel TMEM175